MTAPKRDFDSLTPAQAALAYARIGLRVLPVARESKRPLTAHGAHDATSDEATIRACWKRWPQANVGIALDGLVVVDVDPRNGAPADRDEIAATLGPWPETAEAITGGGGRHLYFRARDGLQPPRAVAQGIDIKSGPGAYVVAPPSVHANGRRYAWDGLADPIEALRALPAAPEWVYRRAAGPRDAAPEDDGAPIPEGQRNETLFRLGCALRRRGLSRAGIEAALLAENAQRCMPPLPEEEVRRIAESCARYRAGAAPHSPPEAEAAFARKPKPVNTDAARSPEEALALLNALPVWDRRVRWAAFRRVGGTLVGITEDGQEARYEVAKLVEFRHIHARTLEYLGVSITPPKKGHYAVVAGTIGELMLRAAEADTLEAGMPEDDLRAMLTRCWRGAGCPSASENAELFQYLDTLRNYRRDPHSEVSPPAVILFRGEVLVHPQALQTWLSCPNGASKYLPLATIREALGLLGLRPYEFDVEREGRRICTTLWRGQAGVLHEG